MDGMRVGGSGGRGRRRSRERRPQLTGRVHGGRSQRLLDVDGVADAKAFLPVGFEHVGETEALTAHLTGVGLLPGVGAAVTLHVWPACEALPADLTDVRFLSCINIENKS